MGLFTPRHDNEDLNAKDNRVPGTGDPAPRPEPEKSDDEPTEASRLLQVFLLDGSNGLFYLEDDDAWDFYDGEDFVEIRDVHGRSHFIPYNQIKRLMAWDIEQ